MSTLMEDIQARYQRKLAALGIEDHGPQVDPTEPPEIQAARFSGDHEVLERLLREQERQHRERVDLERLEKLRRSLLVPQHGAFRHPRAQPDLNVWVGPCDMFRIHQPRKAQPPPNWITERR